MSGRGRHFQPRWKKRKSSNNASNERRPSTDDPSDDPMDGTSNTDSNNSDQASADIPALPANGDGSPKPRTIKRDTPYPAWELYFDNEEYKKSSPLLPKVQTMEKFLEANPQIIKRNGLKETFAIDVNLLYSSEIFAEYWSDFKSELTNKPQLVLNCLGLAVHKARAVYFEKETKVIDVDALDQFARIQITNFEPILLLKNIKVNYYQQFITVRGCIIRVNRSCEMPSVLVIVCNKCKLPYTIKQKNGIYSLKKKCDICGAMKFEQDLASPYMETIPMQIIRIQEHFGQEHDDQGRVPRVMDVELYEELVDACMPGDDVTVTGIMKMQGADNGVIKANAVSNSLYMEANFLVNNNIKSKNGGGLGMELSTADYRSIRDIFRTEDTLGLLVHSLCPSIFGHEMIKTALLLSLFGGSPKHANIRENIHVLIVGDPGLGKSQMLQACSRVAPKGIYVSGNSSTSSGLTVTLIREKGQSDFALEPGALVLADRGCCCIDEFDKMPTQHQALLEAMEQQSVSVAKSGVIWSLPSRTSILAAANPIGGRYDKSKLLSKNLNMSQPLLSRFDLVFLLLDEPDKNRDNFLSEHVMLMHAGHEPTKSEEFARYSRETTGRTSSLKKRLTAASRNSMGRVSPSFLRKYISYARQYVKPKLSTESAGVLQKFYLGLRSKMESAVNLTPCARQLEALVRLTEARAKLELREQTTEQDALDVIELLQSTVLGMDDDVPDCPVAPVGKATKSGGIKAFLKLLEKDVVTREGSSYSKEELKSIAMKGGIASTDVSSAIDKLNEEGFLIKKDNREFKFVSPH